MCISGPDGIRTRVLSNFNNNFYMVILLYLHNKQSYPIIGVRLITTIRDICFEYPLSNSNYRSQYNWVKRLAQPPQLRCNCEIAFNN